MKTSGNEWDGWYLVRAYSNNMEPFAVLSDLRENAEEVCKKARPGITDEKDYDYMRERREVENWLREGAQTAGVDMRKENPVYFALTRDLETFASFMLQPMPGNPQRAERKIIVIPASEADLSKCSFTYGDSFPNHRAAHGVPFRVGTPHPLHGLILNAKQMAKALKTYEEPGVGNYIEVQMWDRPPVDVASATQVIRPLTLMNGRHSSGHFIYPSKSPGKF